MQARKFCPGQFYRVQNFESLAPTVEGTVLAAEGLALTGAWVDKERGLIPAVAAVGWVEQSETHHPAAGVVMGFGYRLYPSYAGCGGASL